MVHVDSCRELGFLYFCLIKINFLQKIHPLIPDKNSIINAVKSELKDLYGDRLVKLVLYGSYARGEAAEGSDIDFLAILKDKNIKTGVELRFMNSSLYELERRFDSTISVHPTSLDRFMSSSQLYYQNIRREGIEV